MLLKSFFKNKRVLLSLLLTVFLIAFYLFKENPMFSGFLVKYIGIPYRTVMGELASFLPFSLAEFFVFFVVGVAIVYFVFTVVAVLRSNKNKLKLFASNLLNMLIGVLVISVMMAVFWGANYYIESPVSAIATAKPVSVEQLTAVTALFAQKLNATAPLVTRDENGVYSEDKEQLFELGINLYDNLEEAYPSLQGSTHSAKSLVISPFMSEMNYTGFFFPITGEANVNSHQPACTLPSTIAHELAHVRGVAPEQDCNFLAILACEFSEIPAYQYSGYMLGYVNLANNLYRADYDAWAEITETLHHFVKADISYNNEYWSQYDSVAAEVADTLYEGYLQGHGQTDGLKSYGMVTDLLIDYYY